MTDSKQVPAQRDLELDTRTRMELSRRLKAHREEIAKALRCAFRQEAAAKQVGVSLPTYQKAESDAVLPLRSRWKYEKWLATDVSTCARRARRDRLV